MALCRCSGGAGQQNRNRWRKINYCKGEKKATFYCQCVTSPLMSLPHILGGRGPAGTPSDIFKVHCVFINTGTETAACDFPYGIQWSIKQNEWLSGRHPSTHYRGRQDGFDISNTLSDSRKRPPLISGQDRAQGHNSMMAFFFLKSVVGCKGKCKHVKQRIFFIANVLFQNWALATCSPPIQNWFYSLEYQLTPTSIWYQITTDDTSITFFATLFAVWGVEKIS